MAADGDHRTAMTPAGEDELVADLRSQLVSLRRRLEELEKENKRLVSDLSNCQCSNKEKDVKSPQITSLSSIKTDKIEKKCNQLIHEGSSLSNKRSLKTMKACNKRYIALTIMYFGQRYFGFASEATKEPTVESEIFKALERTKILTGNIKESNYSRCGRTDRGVSATGQVISLFVRSNLKDDNNSESEEKPEIDYVKVLNRVLPSDIRVTGWSPVRTDFNARFSCLYREYKYMFWKENLDIEKMRDGAKRLIGTHDFRNFCKMDALNVSNFKRHITSFDIFSTNQRSSEDELYEMRINGSAFLWHQVRCMVAVLFLIGQNLESPDIIDTLLDLNITKKPQYNMAHELPLILRSCHFNDVNFTCSSDANRALIEHLKNEYHKFMLQAAIFHEALDCLCSTEESSAETDKKKRGHIPLLLRQTEPSYEERRAKLETKLTTVN
ncbi:hypothetical protein LUZ60_006728 [Juncus effusus]|nr:hypothetical protein LUZ60_006728 [Juncus effusus]